MGDFGTYMSFIPDDVVEFRNRQRELIRAGIAATPELESRRVMIYVLAEISVSLKRLADCKAEATAPPRAWPPRTYTRPDPCPRCRRPTIGFVARDGEMLWACSKCVLVITPWASESQEKGTT